MIGKFFLLAFLCISLTQVHGEELESVINRAINSLKDVSMGAERRVDVALKEYNSKLAYVKSAAEMFLSKENKIEDQNKQTIQRVAEQMKEKAKQTDKPLAVFECIDNIKAETISKIEAVAPKFETDLKRLEKTKMIAFEVAVKPLEDIKYSLEEKYEKGVKEIQSCKSSMAVNKTLGKIRREYNLMISEVGRAQSQITLVYNNFQRDVGIMFNNVNRTLQRVLSDGIRTIKRCLYRRNGLFGDN